MDFTLISLHTDPVVVFHCANISVVWMQTNTYAKSPSPLSNPDEYSYEQMWIGRWPSKPHSNHCRWGDIHDALSYVRSSSSSFYMLFVSSIPSGTLCSRRFRITVATGFQNNHLCSPVRHISWNNHRLEGCCTSARSTRECINQDHHYFLLPVAFYIGCLFQPSRNFHLELLRTHDNQTCAGVSCFNSFLCLWYC